MKAIVYTHYGSPDVLHLKEVEKPAPKADEVLIEIQAASANPADWHTMRATPFLARSVNGFFKPKTPGSARISRDALKRLAKPSRSFESGMMYLGAWP